MTKNKFTEIKDYSFNDFVSKNKFVVPPFQRAYEWKSDRIGNLWLSILDNEQGYFIGNIVCLAASEDTDDRVVIIDGQQRLFTISLFLIAARDLLTKIMNSLKDEHRETVFDFVRDTEQLLIFKSTFSLDKNESLRLKPAKQNLFEFYQNLVKQQFDFTDKSKIRDLDDNQRKFLKNYKFIYNLIYDYAMFDLSKLNDLISKIVNLTFIVIICDTDNDAYKIFEGLNSTGLGLYVSDLVKNAVMMKVAKVQEAKNYVEEIWLELESLFEEKSTSLFPTFLRHQWISREGYITKSKLFGEIKTKLKTDNVDDVKTRVKELLDDAKVYFALRFSGYESKLHSKLTPQIQKNIEKFRMLELDQIYEVLLALYRRYSKGSRYSAKKFSRDLQNLWIFAFRAKIMSINPSEYEKIFAEYCLKITSKETSSLEEISKYYIDKLYKLVGSDQTFAEHFATDLEYKTENIFLTYILDTLLRYKNADIRVAEPNIEHILPRDPKNWGLSYIDIQDFVNNVGNLTLLYKNDNQKLGNSKMSKKVQDVYSKSKFELNKRLEDLEKDFSSNPEQAIENRGRSLGILAAKIWRLKN